MRNCNAKNYADDEHLRQNDPEQFNYPDTSGSSLLPKQTNRQHQQRCQTSIRDIHNARLMVDIETFHIAFGFLKCLEPRERWTVLREEKHLKLRELIITERRET